MLDQQDKMIIREIVGEEIGNKTSDLRQNVSILQQDMTALKQDVTSLGNNFNSFKQENSKKLDHLGVLMEDNGRVMQLILENLSQNNKKMEEIPEMKNKVGHHEIRIGALELAVKRKLA